jgi:hypothetical protein
MMNFMTAWRSAIPAMAATLIPCLAYAACEPIRFAPGASSATINGMALPAVSPFVCYTLATGKGQTASLKLTRSNGDTAFNISDVIDNRDEYSFKTEARTYQISLYQMSRGATKPAPFTLSVSVR